MTDPGGKGLRGKDKQQAALRGKGNYEHLPSDLPETDRSPQQAAQKASPARGQPPMKQGEKGSPEGLERPRKGPYDKNVGRNENATQLPKNQ